MIILATHLQPESLPEHFIEIQRQQCDPVPGAKKNPLFWSEYTSFLSRPATGWLHYRCVLNPTGFSIPALPWSARHGVLCLLYRYYLPEVTYVGEDVCENEIIFDQFLSCHPEAEQFLLHACGVYKDLTGLDPLSYVQKKRGFTARNMIVGPLVSEWSRLARMLISKLDDYVDVPDNDRHGGYVLERLFSFFVSDKKVEKAGYLYFDPPQ